LPPVQKAPAGKAAVGGAAERPDQAGALNSLFNVAKAPPAWAIGEIPSRRMRP